MLLMRVNRANLSQDAAEEKVRPHDEARCFKRHDADADDALVLLPPINFIFKLLQSRATISVWLYENLGLRIEGKLRVCPDNLLDASHGMLMSRRASTSS